MSEKQAPRGISANDEMRDAANRALVSRRVAAIKAIRQGDHDEARRLVGDRLARLLGAR